MPSGINVSVTDNSGAVLKELTEKTKLILDALGETAEGHAKDDCPVDTGRLRNSITYATKTGQGKANTSRGQPAAPEEYKKKEEPENGTVYIGTNVEYAPAQEFYDMNHKSGKAHFLRDAAANHTQEYKNIIEAGLKA